MLMKTMTNHGIEILEFVRPEGNRKNLFITGIPQLPDDELTEILLNTFSKYGLVYGVNVYPLVNKKIKSVTEGVTECQTDGGAQDSENSSGFYAFVTYYLAMNAKKAKDTIGNSLFIKGTMCKVSFAKRKKDVTEPLPPLHFTKCQELANCYLGFNGWSLAVKMLEKDCEQSVGQLQKVRYVCVIKLDITKQYLTTEGMGAWEETYATKDPQSHSKALCKCKKLAYQRAIENAFSRVLLIVLGNGKVMVEINTVKPEIRLSEKKLDDEPVLKINELDETPPDEEDVDFDNEEDMDAMNLHILHQLEDEM